MKYLLEVPPGARVSYAESHGTSHFLPSAHHSFSQRLMRSLSLMNLIYFLLSFKFFLSCPFFFSLSLSRSPSASPSPFFLFFSLVIEEMSVISSVLSFRFMCHLHGPSGPALRPISTNFMS